MNHPPSTEEMRALKKEGMSLRQIGDRFGMSGTGVFYRLGGEKKSRSARPAANDNKIIKMMPHNGGCSTTSGLMPVSLARTAQQVAA
ncbi:hypothetical protein CWR43_27935 [Rhizobium sullae]|uniref:Resolvase HTH domain-containing protein n=1 Tax=Rhizobium sullae TaxID=50338 RepID=A0A2N0D2T5_RHISU|nr:hypothetical protein [Rhizobium sullae]PKA40414.1 hypothetical protein CWR43_27935 [Rhizobium sullae]